MKHWHEKYPFRFGLIFIIVYGLLDVMDARWFIPRTYKNTDTQEWINIKGSKNG